ncbi:MAG: sigma-54 interaction domain-containing protein [Halothiobacillaceae bacterium]
MSAFDRLLTRTPVFETVLRSAQIVAATEATALLVGETGTGKELMARALHEGSARANKPFVAINCSAIPEALAESELFGHGRGAFTGAVEARGGQIRAAEGGTLFLDEVGELPMAVQAKLLRFLESGEIQPVGSARPVRVNVRVVAATHRDLAELVREGRFRQDLFYRLQVVPVQIPPLRARRPDISLLFEHFAKTFAQAQGLQAPRLSPEALEVVQRHDWPGNVRELRNLAERLTVFHGGCEVDVLQLPPDIRERAPTPRGGGLTGAFVLPAEGIDFESLESELLRQALERTDGNKSRAARLLGLTRDTFLYRLRKFAIA